MVLRALCAGWLHEWDNSRCCSAEEDAGGDLLLSEPTAKELKEVDITNVMF